MLCAFRHPKCCFGTDLDTKKSQTEEKNPRQQKFQTGNKHRHLDLISVLIQFNTNYILRIHLDNLKVNNLNFFAHINGGLSGGRGWA